ncbi:unnamed protein product [Soboliphyme baturini]|uniref:Uncharacterized protein n=1 Tax=Soboliphyme baturini TaxID=241478 RepID=A0A183J734_9BILA|nr:unnamed protein product [Soboliphyme baturini]
MAEAKTQLFVTGINQHHSKSTENERPNPVNTEDQPTDNWASSTTIIFLLPATLTASPVRNVVNSCAVHRCILRAVFRQQTMTTLNKNDVDISNPRISTSKLRQR